MTITEFLLARIAEDEAQANEAIVERARAVPDAGPDFDLIAWPDSGVPAVLVGPERVLAECAAKRRIVETIEGTRANATYTTRLLSILLMLASVHADHPDYDEAWKV